MSKAEQAELEAYTHVSEELQAAGGFGSYPVRVLTAKEHGFAREAWALWESLHTALAGEASDGEQIFFPGAGHSLQFERPREVAAIIIRLVERAPVQR